MKIEHDDDTYCISEGDNSGDRVNFGDAALLEHDGALYAAFLVGPAEAFDECAQTIYRLDPITTTVEEVVFEDEDAGESED